MRDEFFWHKVASCIRLVLVYIRYLKWLRNAGIISRHCSWLWYRACPRKVLRNRKIRSLSVGAKPKIVIALLFFSRAIHSHALRSLSWVLLPKRTLESCWLPSKQRWRSWRQQTTFFLKYTSFAKVLYVAHFVLYPLCTWYMNMYMRGIPLHQIASH